MTLSNRSLQLEVFLLWIVASMLFYCWQSNMTADQAWRYTFDVGFNIGTGEGNINEKDDGTSMGSVVVMLSGYFLVALFWTDFVAFLLGKEDAQHCATFQELFVGGSRLFKTLGVSQQRLVAYNALLVWTIIGVCIGVYQEGFSYVVALNFAVGLMTSTGSQQPDNNPTSNLLAGFYMLVGIPLLAIATTLLIESLPPSQCTDTEQEGKGHRKKVYPGLVPDAEQFRL